MTVWRLNRAIITALAFLSVSIALMAAPERGVAFWHLYFSPVMLAALSFGLRGAMVVSAASIVAVVFVYLRFVQLMAQTGGNLIELFGSGRTGTSDLQEFARSAPATVWLRLSDGAIGLGTGGDQLLQAVIGVLLIAGMGALAGWLVDQRRRQTELYQREARTDELTGVGNYRRLMDALDEELVRAKRFHHGLAFLMVDVDGLKPYNDDLGHQAGDLILQQIAQALKTQLREVDVVCRYGGDEFGILLLETGREGAVHAAERVRQAVAALAVPVRGVEARVTISIGVALFPEDGSNVDEVIAAADACLYRAKLNGKNRVETNPPAKSSPPANG